MADVPPTTGFEPDLAENDDLRVKPLFFHRPGKIGAVGRVGIIQVLEPRTREDEEASQNFDR